MPCDYFELTCDNCNKKFKEGDDDHKAFFVNQGPPHVYKWDSCCHRCALDGGDYLPLLCDGELAKDWVQITIGAAYAAARKPRDLKRVDTPFYSYFGTNPQDKNKNNSRAEDLD